MANFSVCFIFPFFSRMLSNGNNSCPDLINTENSDLSEIDWPSFISEVSDQRLLRVVAVIIAIYQPGLDVRWLYIYIYIHTHICTDTCIWKIKCWKSVFCLGHCGVFLRGRWRQQVPWEQKWMKLLRQQPQSKKRTHQRSLHYKGIVLIRYDRKRINALLYTLYISNKEELCF